MRKKPWLLITQEELEVDKVAQQEEKDESASSSASLLRQVKTLIDESKQNKDDTAVDEQKKEDEEQLEDDQSANIEETGNEPEDTDEDSENMTNAEGGEDTLGVGSESIIESVEIFMALEENVDLMVAHSRIDNVNYTQEDWRTLLEKSGAFLKNVGVPVSTFLIKKIGAGLVAASTMAAKGVYYSFKALAKAVDQSVNSYRRLHKKIDSIEQSLKLIEEESIEKVTNGLMYEKQSVVNSIFSGTRFNPAESLKNYNLFVKNYVQNNTGQLRVEVNRINGLLGQIMTSRINNPQQLMRTNDFSKGLVRKDLAGYAPPNDLLDTYVSEILLPGNVRYACYLPKEDIETVEDFYLAYKHTDFFFAKEFVNFTGFSKVPYATTKEVKEMLGLIKEAVQQGETQLKTLASMLSLKNSLNAKIKAALTYAQAKVTQEKSVLTVLQFFNLKLYLIKEGFVRTNIEVELQNRKILFSYVRYLEASLLQLADQSRKM